MQLASAFSRPQTVPPVPKTVPKRNLWILSCWRDLLLYVGTPLLLVPLFTLAQTRWRGQDIYLFVAAFGATGHHLPGMIRAYGDRALFERFRWRFIFAPIFLVVVCVAFTWWDLKGIVFVVFFWGVWHGMMQTYGFCRIYDAKAGSFAALTRRLDLATCAIWFATAVFLSRLRMTDTLEMYYATGGPYIPPAFLHTGQKILLGVAVAVSALFLANFARMWIGGQRPNPVKIALLTTSIAFWWYCNNGVGNILVGIALFEVFHDVQYLSLVWVYNRNRVDKDRTIGGFMRFVFRRSGAFVGVYVGLVLAYGSLALLKEVEIDTVKRALNGLVAASGLLHFYYDGFIWKVRESSTREHLGLTGGTATATASQFLPGWALHGLKWVAVFIIPLGALWIGQLHNKVPEVQREGWVVDNLPHSERAHYKYGAVLQESQRFAEAEEQFRVALKINPNTQDDVDYSLGHSLLSQSKFDEAKSALEQALRKDPRNAEVRSEYASVLEQVGRKEQAVDEYSAAVRLNPKSGRVHYDYAMFLLRDNQLDQAAAEFQESLRCNPKSSEAHYHLGRVLFLKRDLEGAKSQYLEAARLDPKAPVHNSLGVIYMRLGDTSAALAEFQEALRQHPDDATAAENLEFVRNGGRANTPTQP